MDEKMYNSIRRDAAIHGVEKALKQIERVSGMLTNLAEKLKEYEDFELTASDEEANAAFADLALAVYDTIDNTDVWSVNTSIESAKAVIDRLDYAWEQLTVFMDK